MYGEMYVCYLVLQISRNYVLVSQIHCIREGPWVFGENERKSRICFVRCIKLCVVEVPHQ